MNVFGSDPWWIIIIKVVVIFVFLVLFTLFNIWFERRVVAKMQHRDGPTKHGPFGLLQSLADGVKLMLKEDILPRAADKAVFIAAPAISAVCAFLTYSVIPFGPRIRLPGSDIITPLQLTDLPVSVLFVLAIASIGIYGIVLGGWSSNATYSLLGALRSSAQLISYEVAMGLALVAVFLYAGSMSTSEIVAAQDKVWFCITLIPSFLLYLTAMVGETNRAPFDLPEAEGELVAGYLTEYSSIKYALFFLAEYINMATVSAIATTLFLGGWHPLFPFNLFDWASEGLVPIIWFLIKLLAFIFVFIWLRGTLPRLRYDQFMKFGWKVLIPVSLVWIVLVALLRGLTTTINVSRTALIIAAAVIVVILGVVAFAPGRDRAGAEDDEDYADEDDEPVGADLDADRLTVAGGGTSGTRYTATFPTPPMPHPARAGAASPNVVPSSGGRSGTGGLRAGGKVDERADANQGSND